MSYLSLDSSAPSTSQSAIKQGPRIVKIAELDTSVVSLNLGDQIIMDASRAVLRKLFPDAFYVSLPTHEFLLWESYRVLKDCDYVFVGGSNLLKSSMMWNNQWKISPIDFLKRKSCILLGCGWWHYQATPDWYSKLMLKNILSKKHMHAVRDQYSLQQLHAANIHNVLNTACVTMWGLNKQHCATIPSQRAPRVVTTLTAYNSNLEADRATIELMLKEYEEVLLWPQQPDDLAYGLGLANGAVKVISPNLASYTELLRDNHVDYIGSRLHGGIRALQMGKRSLILAIDNRAMEITRDTNLPVVARGNISAIQQWITGSAPTQLNLPEQAIASWMNQFVADPNAATRVQYGS